MILIPGYRVQEELGSGASGTVYRAVQEELSREVALKVLATELFGEAETRARFLREARIQARLSHPNLVTLFDAGFSGKHPYLATELVPGGTLRDLVVSRGSRSVHGSLAILQSLASGLAQAHGAGIVHRDLKPENILLDSEGSPKIADFGLSKHVEAGRTLHTAEGTVLGTPGYLPPEAIEGRGSGSAGDVYALGAVGWEVLAGAHPFLGADLNATFRNQLQGALPRLSSHREAVIPGLEQLLHDCLDRDPDRRPSAVEVEERAADLMAELASRGGRSPAPTLQSQRVSAASWPGAHPTSVRFGVRQEADHGRTRQVARESGSRRRLALQSGLGVLMALLLATFGYLRWGVAPVDVAGPLEPEIGSAASLPEPPKPPALPGLVRVDVGDSRARIEIASDAPKGLEFEFWPDQSEMRSTRSFPAGGRELTISGLSPGKKYNGRLKLDRRQTVAEFETLPGISGSEFHRLDPGRMSIDELSLASLGNRVVLAYRFDYAPQDDVVGFLESRDGGRTWGEVQDVGRQNRAMVRGMVAATEAGVLLTWLSATTGGGATWVRFKPWDSTEWGEEFRWHGNDPGPAIAVRPDGGFDHTSTGRVLQDGLFWRRLDAAGRTVEGPLKVTSRVKWVKTSYLVRTSSRLTSFLKMSSDEYDPHGIYWTSTENPSHGGWSEPEPLAPAGAGWGRLALTSLGDRIVAVYTSGRGVRVRLSEDGGATFQEPLEPVQDPENLRLPSLATGNGTHYLCLERDGEWMSPISLLLYSSLDGKSWKKLTTIRSQFISLRETHLAVCDERLVLVVRADGLDPAVITIPLEGLTAAGR